MQKEKNSIEARLGVVRYFLLTIVTLLVVVLIAISLLLYNVVSGSYEELERSYSFGDYMGTVSPVLLPVIVIFIIAGFAIYYGYSMYLKRDNESEGG